MNKKSQGHSARRGLLGAALLLIVVGAACAPVRTGTGWADVTLVGEAQNIFVAYNDRLEVVDAATGALVPLRNADGEIRRQDGEVLAWEFNGRDTSSQFFSAPIFLDDSTVLIADYNQKLLQINYTAARVDNPTNVELPGNVVADLTIADGRLFVPLSDANLIALDAETYDTLWTFETERGVWSQPLVIDDVVYFTTMDHRFYAVNAETGEEIWGLELGGAAPAAPLYDEENSRFFVGTFDRKVLEISTQGEILSSYETEDWVWSTPVLFDGVLYTADLSGYVYALALDGGLVELWKTQAANGGIRPAPLVTDQYVVVAARSGEVVWLTRADGVETFNADVDAEVLSDILLVEPRESLNIAEPYVIVSTVRSSKLLVAFNLSDGLLRWTYSR